MKTIASDTRQSRCRCGVQVTGTVEDYLKEIFAITSLGESASTSSIAARLGVTAPSVTSMLIRLRSNRLVEQTAWGRVALTEHGREHALAVVRRHRLVETFLHRVLGVAWDEIHDEAEVLEHHLSERLEYLMDAALGFPERDPHGDPIPRPTVPHEEHSETPLTSTAPGDRFVVQRVNDGDSATLRHLESLGLVPGASLEVEGRSSDVGPMWVRIDNRRSLLSGAVVNLIHGEVLTSVVTS